MVKLFAGEKGEGKTKKLIAMANAALDTSDGHIVYIDDDGRNMHELHYKVRLVDTSGYPLSNYREFISFIYGMLSQNSDIAEIYIDSLSGIVPITNDELANFSKELSKISDTQKVAFFLTLNCNPAELPEEAQKLMVS